MRFRCATPRCSQFGTSAPRSVPLLPADGLFGPLSTTDAMADAVGDRAWVQAMLDVEAALASAEERAGLIPGGSAVAIKSCCSADRFDIDQIGRAAASSATPVLPLVGALARAVGPPAGEWVHWGATSQDILDTAMVLVARRGIDLVLRDLTRAAGGAARLARSHRETIMVGRTLLQPAVPITFGLKCAGWLAGILDSRERVSQARQALAVQLGGAAGTLASMGPAGPRVLRALAEELSLPEPALPWHSTRNRIVDVGAALGVACGVMGKIALDVALLMQAEVGEVAEAAEPGRGGSSAMPNKRNPVAAVAVGAAVRRSVGLVATLFGAMAQEHERAVGAWQSEWETLTELLRLSGGAVATVAALLEGLDVDADRMRANLDVLAGRPLAEHVAMVLMPRVGRPRAAELVEAAVRTSTERGISMRDALVGDPHVMAHLSAPEIDAALDPAGYLGSTDLFVERTLHRFEESAR